MTTARHPSKCHDRCGLQIHVGDEIERGHFGWRHVDCESSHIQAQVRAQVAAGRNGTEIWAWLNNSPSLTLDQRLDAIAYAQRDLGAAVA